MDHPKDIAIHGAAENEDHEASVLHPPPAYKDAEEDDDDSSRQAEIDHSAVGTFPDETEDRLDHIESVAEHRENEADSGIASDRVLFDAAVATLGIVDESVEGTLGEESIVAHADALVPAPPSKPELTLKEKLVLRERQRRIETERARLKRQFALNNEGEVAGDGSNELSDANRDSVAALGAVDGSVAGTLGEESTVAHADEESTEQEKLGFNMERFLRNSDTFNPELEPTDEEKPAPDQGVLMERFLNEPVEVESASETRARSSSVEDDAQRTVSFDDDNSGTSMVKDDVDEGLPDRTSEVVAGSLQSGVDDLNASIDVDANSSIIVEADDDVADQDITMMAPVASVSSAEEPRVLGLTEADMAEMAAIEVASIGNEPPSEREDEIMSEIGELADFGGHNIPDDAGNFSQAPTENTTMASSSSILSGGNQSARVVDQPSSMQGTASDSSHLLESTAVASALHDENHQVFDNSLRGSHDLEDGTRQVSLVSVSHAPLVPESEENNNEGIANQQRIGILPKANPKQESPVTEASLCAPLLVDNFDFDKHEPSSPVTESRLDDRWPSTGQMHVSPLHSGERVQVIQKTRDSIPFVSANTLSDVKPAPIHDAPTLDQKEDIELLAGESTPLMNAVPGEIITRQKRTECRELESSLRSAISARRDSIHSAVGSIFSDLRSEEDYEVLEIISDSEKYVSSSTLARAFPERMFALIVTLIFELPVLFMISGGSDALCSLLGRTRYQLLVGFIPLTSAISGNVGLQASTLTTRAISHTHVTQSSYTPWFSNEVGAAAYLGIAMGFVIGLIGFFASGMDFGFGATLMIAQFISTVTAGCTGTIAPLLFTFIFQRDAGKWGGPLETAIQDIVGSFSMVVISYHLLRFFGTGPVDPSDMCGEGEAASMS